MRPIAYLSLSFLVLLGCNDSPSDDRALGPSDDAATLSCDAAGESPTPIALAGQPDAAEDAVIVLPDQESIANVYSVSLPPSGLGYAVLRITSLHNDVALFVSERNRITHLEPDGISSSLRHGVCPEVLIDDYRAHIHEPDDYRLTFEGEGSSEFTLVSINAKIGHGDDTSDGGAHHHDGDAGPHHHEEDAGAHHHEEDAGAHHHEEDAGAHHHDDP